MAEIPNDISEKDLNTTEPLRRAIGDRYLKYALSTIMNRALPDARDGLKPVHRRILFAMRELKLASDTGYRKSAKISGDVMGNYHPHGDQAIYDALARLAQDFNVRYPLVDGQGNFGNIDGDNPAAARYTEARMTKAAELLLEGISQNAVEFNDNYDGTLKEPIVLPATFPNLLANGSSGIAVGMATNVPPHNLIELFNACTHLLDNPNAHDETLFRYIKGPDFPTGGVIVEPEESRLESYKTGRGSIRLRARWELESFGRGQWQIVVTEIPYQVQKSKLIEKIAELIQTKKVPALDDIRDESAEDIRIVLEPRSKNISPEALMETIFRVSDLEIRFNMNMNVLIDGLTPKVCSLKELLRAFLNHRRVILIKCSRFRLKKIDYRLEVLEGFLIAFLNLDRVIDIIRYDESPKSALMYADWSVRYVRVLSESEYISPNETRTQDVSLSETQAEAILNMRLRSLRRLEEVALQSERNDLMIERESLEDLLDDKALQWDTIKDQIKKVKKSFYDEPITAKRRTSIEKIKDIEEISFDSILEKEPITIVCSKMGWIRSLRGHIDLNQDLKFKDGDEKSFIFHAETTDKILAFGANGRFYTIACSNLPGGRGMGEPVRLIIDLPNESNIVDLFVYDETKKLLVASDVGDGFIVPENEVIAQTKNGKQVLNLASDHSAAICCRIKGDHIAVISSAGKLLVFPIDELPEMNRGKGVRLQKYSKAKGKQGSLMFDGGLSDITTFNFSEGLSWTISGGKARNEKDMSSWVAKRASVGKKPPHGFPKRNLFV